MLALRADKLPLVLILLVFLFVGTACGSSKNDDPAVIDGDADTTDQTDIVTDGDSEADLADVAEVEEETTPSCPATIEARPTPTTGDTTFDLGPYLMHTTTESAVVMWRTLTETPGKVVYGEGDALDKEVAQTGTSKVHEITLTGLKADTRYAYKVVSGETESAVHHLHSAPAPYMPFRFTVAGDSQGHPEIFSPIVGQMAAFEPFLFLHVGDTVQDPTMSETYDPFKTEFYDPLRALGHEIPLYIAIGNHEKESATFYELVSYPGLQKENPKYESTYSFRYGNAFFLVLNTNQLLLSAGKLADFVKEQVESEAAKTATWRFAVAHYPGYSEVWGSECNFDGYELSRDWLLPLFGENKFHVFFSGHAHDYLRGQSNGVVTIITGGGGGGLDVFCKNWDEISVVRYVHHHMQVEAGCDTLKLRAIDTDNNEIDHVTLDAARYGEIVDAGPADPVATKRK